MMNYTAATYGIGFLKTPTLSGIKERKVMRKNVGQVESPPDDLRTNTALERARRKVGGSQRKGETDGPPGSEAAAWNSLGYSKPVVLNLRVVTLPPHSGGGSNNPS